MKTVTEAIPLLPVIRLTQYGTMVPVDHPQFADQIRSRNPEALQAVVKAYLTQILRAARGAGLDETAAEDVTQSTFMTFIEKAPDFDGRSHVRTWLFGILYKKILEAHRETRRAQRIDDIDDVMERRFNTDGMWMRPPRPADAELYGSEIRTHLEECLERVPRQQRIAFMLREVEGYTTKEICKILEVSRTNLGAMLHRCRNRLRECLESKGIEGSHHA
jgi:RNA polymerase sigma-70 factor (ECF subfamily)